MHIHCPTCAADYDLPAILLTVARTMRCAVCGQEWQTDAIDLATARADMHAPASAPPAAMEAPMREAAEVLAAAAAGVVASVAAQMLASPAAADAAEEVPEPSAEAEGDARHEMEAESAESADAAVVEPAPQAGDVALAPAIPATRRARMSTLLHGAVPALLGWVFSLAVLFISGRAAVEYRAGIIDAWPPSRRLFLWLGLS